MADQYKHPLIEMLTELFVTPQGRAVADDAKLALDTAKDATGYYLNAPDRAMARMENPNPHPGPGEALSAGADLALLLSSLYGIGRTGAKVIGKKATDWVKAPPLPKQGPNIPKDAATYTDRHGALAQAELRKLLAVPDKNLSHKTLKEGYQARVAKAKHLNVGPQGQQLDDMVTETLRRVPTTTKLNDPGSVNWAVNRSTGIRKAGKPVTMGLAGAAALSDDEIEALLAEIVGGSK